MTAGALAGAGWVAAGMGITSLCERRPVKLYLLDAGLRRVLLSLIIAFNGAAFLAGPPNLARPDSSVLTNPRCVFSKNSGSG
jgi:hypothetical protein